MINFSDLGTCFQNNAKARSSTKLENPLKMFFFKMNFMIIGHDLVVSSKKTYVSFLGHFWGRLPFDPKIFAKKCPFKLKNWLVSCFCMGNLKKMVSGRFVGPSDSNLG
jgi:hypothetical protein